LLTLAPFGPAAVIGLATLDVATLDVATLGTAAIKKFAISSRPRPTQYRKTLLETCKLPACLKRFVKVGF
jgi:hypothetical protein